MPRLNPDQTVYAFGFTFSKRVAVFIVAFALAFAFQIIKTIVG